MATDQYGRPIYEDPIKEYQKDNEKKFGKKNQDDKYDPSKIEKSKSPTPQDQSTGNINIDLQRAIDRRMERKVKN